MAKRSLHVNEGYVTQVEGMSFWRPSSRTCSRTGSATVIVGDAAIYSYGRIADSLC